MSVVLVVLVSLTVVLVTPPVLLALLLRVIAPNAAPDEDCRPSSRRLIAALRRL
jgi:hypothetical protein